MLKNIRANVLKPGNEAHFSVRTLSRPNLSHQD